MLSRTFAEHAPLAAEVKAKISSELGADLRAAADAALAGRPVPADAFLDSFDVSGALLGRAGAKGRASLVQQDNGQLGNYGYRAGNWKLVRHDSKQAYNRRVEERLRNGPVPPFQLFSMAVDSATDTDRSASRSSIDAIAS